MQSARSGPQRSGPQRSGPQRFDPERFDPERFDPVSLARSLAARDQALWPEPNVSATRLGWLDVPQRMSKEAADLASWAQGIEQETIVLLGMGGSSLGPAVLEAVLLAHGRDTRASSSRARRRLIVCDTTHPDTVASLPYEEAFFLVSSKSGTTLEPNVLLDAAMARQSDPRRYAAITDPGTPLARLATERGFHRLFQNPPEIGGRYSVLSYFGMVPATLIGYDVQELCARALETDTTEAAELGIRLGSAVAAGRDKATVVVPPSFSSFGLWVEQLIAESTGKHGTGCVPVPTTQPEEGADREVVQLDLREPADLAEQFYRWEVATAICGHVLGIDPFDEPNVAESKKNTNDVLADLPLPLPAEIAPSDAMEWLRTTVRPGDYVSLQAYLPYGHDQEVEGLRRLVRDQFGGIATTAGYGPRFLHSTGQLHKGGPNSVVALQIVSRSDRRKLPIPGRDFDFGTLIAAQAIGDLQSLLDHGRRVARTSVDALSEIA